jgi:glycosyltransferase involved in cell wall biosynthesis
MTATSVMFLVNALGYGGAELQVYRLAVGMRRRGRRVTVVTLIPPVALADDLRRQGVEVLTLNMRPGRPNPLAALRLLKIVRARRPQVLHAHIVHANLLARLVRPLGDIPVLVCTAHSIIEGQPWLELAYRYTDRLGDLTTNVSEAGRRRYVGVGAAPAARIRFVPNGLDLRDFTSDEAARQRLRAELGVEDRFVWLAVGRLTEAKDYPNLLRAFAALSHEGAHRPPVLLLAGRGNLDDETRGAAAALGLGDHVRFLGLRGDVPALMSAADGYVMSSAWEGMPLVLQEASAAELPVVATDVGGTGEVVADGRSGLLVPPKDPAALAAAMRRLMAMTADERAAMGRAGRAHVESQFALERVLDTWEAIYAELLLRRQPAGATRLDRRGRRDAVQVAPTFK